VNLLLTVDRAPLSVRSWVAEHVEWRRRGRGMMLCAVTGRAAA